MAEVQVQGMQSVTPNFFPPELATMGTRRFAELVAAQTQQLGKLREIGDRWVNRMKLQAELASELSTKLTAARSIPEVATAYLEWPIQQMERAADAAKRILADAQRLAEAGARALSGGFRGNGDPDSS